MNPSHQKQAANAMKGGEQIFNGFDMVSEVPDDHYYFRSPKSHGTTKTLSKHVMKEWKILEENLPVSIYIRVYENRIDLMRAVIVGAAGTPYHDGLFFFDIKLPSDYPNRPPNVQFNSSGTLSTRTSTRMARSVLVSIQALVLNEQHYFNVPHIGGWFGRSQAVTQQRSRAYSNLFFLVTWYVAIKLVTRPPKNFEVLWRPSSFNTFARALWLSWTRAVSTPMGAYWSGVTAKTVVVMVDHRKPKKKQVIDRRNHDNKGEVRKNKTMGGVFKKAVDKVKTVLGWKKKKNTNSNQHVVS
ncbi:hypothetical protein PIB30_071253 [Stylosanthes scabra]|uniref:UBC core domain-containing protein n=1 Tax=Stylosanthes scabra TaxID=79078 RepID=A0ABU6ZMI8_9FABA|nr:hypothetical protein [Stylosanthes scabra]